nr:helix-turn-helix transcriptional regulator [Bacillus sp. JCM 19034]
MNGEMTQQELADKLGVSRQTVIAIENEKYSPTLDLAFQIAEIFNQPLEEIFYYQRLKSRRRSEKNESCSL